MFHKAMSRLRLHQLLVDQPPCVVAVEACKIGALYLDQIVRLTEVIEHLAADLGHASKTDKELRWPAQCRVSAR